MSDTIVVVFSSHLSEEENNEFIKHIDDTIGTKHHTICYPNFNQYSLSEIYNKAINDYTVSNSIMVFCHNDIIFKTPNWGKVLLYKFNTSLFHIIGVAGTTYLPESGMWWEDRSKMVGIVEHQNSYDSWVSEYSPEAKGKITPVVLVDGLFIAADCESIDTEFDEEFKGFHFYDLGFTIPAYLDGYNIGVTTDIRILHKSVGMTNDKWEANRLQFVEKYKNELPIEYKG